MLSLKDSSLFRQQAYINGQWVDADNQKTFDVDNPSTKAIIGHVPEMGAAETRRAIEAAQKAWPAWKALSGKDRGLILERWYDLMVANADDLAQILTYEQGKPVAEAKGEILYAASFLSWFAAEASRIDGDVLQAPTNDKKIVVTRHPIGVSAAITPWNFPAAMITRKVGPALAAGCPIVVKPAEATPFSALAMAVLAEKAGVPAGIFSVVTGNPAAIGTELTSNPIVRKLSFTGSTPVGRLLMQQSAATVKKLSLELGGNAPFIVLADADLDAAVTGAIVSKFRNAGQTCVCANRFFVHATVESAFVEKLLPAVRQLKVGDGFEAGVVQGPLINEAGIRKVEELVQDAIQKGAKLLLGGKRTTPDSNFYEPTVLTGITADMRIAHEEIFGPVVAITTFNSTEDMIAKANDTIFGLAAYFYAKDIHAVWHIADALEYGMVGINTGAISNEVMPFGGVKQSGIGREGSKYGIDEYTVMKTLTFGL